MIPSHFYVVVLLSLIHLPRFYFACPIVPRACHYCPSLSPPTPSSPRILFYQPPCPRGRLRVRVFGSGDLILLIIHPTLSNSLTLVLAFPTADSVGLYAMPDMAETKSRLQEAGHHNLIVIGATRCATEFFLFITGCASVCAPDVRRFSAPSLYISCFPNWGLGLWGSRGIRTRKGSTPNHMQFRRSRNSESKARHVIGPSSAFRMLLSPCSVCKPQAAYCLLSLAIRGRNNWCRISRPIWAAHLLSSSCLVLIVFLDHAAEIGTIVARNSQRVRQKKNSAPDH